MTDDAPDDAVPHAGPGDPLPPAPPAVLPPPVTPPTSEAEFAFPEVAAPEPVAPVVPETPEVTEPAVTEPHVGAPPAPIAEPEVFAAEVSEPDVPQPAAVAPAVPPTVPPAQTVTPAEEPAYPVAAVEPTTVTAAPVAKHARKEGTSFLRELPVLVVIAFVLALLIKHFLVQAFYIPSGSMEQTLQVGDRVLVNKVPYLYRGPHRGEVVVFNGLDNFDEGVTFTEPGNPIAKALRKVNSTIGLGAPDEKDYIKRVIGVAGDRVMCCDADGHVVVTSPGGSDATSLDEPYIYEDDQSGTRYFCDAVAKGSPASQQTCPPGSLGVLVPEGRLWVMGDHRGNSSDSRFHITDEHQGTVPEDKVVGKAFTIVYPFGHAGLLHVPDTFSSVALSAEPFVLGAVGVLPLALLRRRRR